MSKEPPKDKDKVPSILEVKPRAKSMRKINSGLPKVTHEEIDNVRRHVLDAVKNNIPNVRAVLGGRVKWTNQQVKLFQIMLNKVLPDLSSSMNEHIHRPKELSQMSREEIERFVLESARREREDPTDTVDAVYEEIPDVTADEAVELMGNNQDDEDTDSR